MEGVSPDDTGPSPSDSEPPPGESPEPGAADRRGADERTFRIPDRPERRYTRSGGVEYEGGAAFHLEPDSAVSAEHLEALLVDVFEADRYVSGDWFDFPRPVYLVHDREVSTAYRVVVRTGRLELHVLPSTDPDGLRAIYDRVTAASEHDWSVRREVDPGV